VSAYCGLAVVIDLNRPGMVLCLHKLPRISCQAEPGRLLAIAASI
jgi:hypothetical protein